MFVFVFVFVLRVVYCFVAMAESLVDKRPEDYIERHENGVFECLLCSKQYKSKAAAKRHFEFVHQGLKKMVCQFVGCDEAYGNYSTLRRHVSRDHGQGLLHCPNTDCKYKSIDVLR